VNSPYHEGERWVQDRTDERHQAERTGIGIRGQIIGGALGFLSDQRILAVASVDSGGGLWASLLCGEKEFVHSSDGTEVILERAKLIVQPQDPLWSNVSLGSKLGLLAIELATRRRLRVNGAVSGLTSETIIINVQEAYPNCPKYIQKREPRGEKTRGIVTPPQRGSSLDSERIALLTKADTLFVASGHPTKGLDASHRGGKPGFVRVLDEQTLRIPDYPGNSMFNTLGNFHVNPRVGLLIWDVEAGRTLQLTGSVTLHFDEEDSVQATGGTKRFWEVQVEQWLDTHLTMAIDWEFFDYSRFNPE
jgi:uncharacterized protein